jgi:CheY-like chemotaxis protein
VSFSVTPYSNSPAPSPPTRTRPHSVQSMRWTIEILVVEDDEADRSLITDVLKRNPNVSAIYATDAPDQALVDLEHDRLRPNLILLDINMPRLNGFQFLEGLRLIPNMEDTPVVVLTTSALARDVQEACTGGVSLYVVKPNSHAEFTARLGSVVNQARTGTWGA